MLNIRKSEERGHAQHGWLDSHHTFSFASYHDPRFMGFGHLRVINEDRVLPGQGFGTHPHRDMEILTYVLEGELQHRDSMGNGSVIRPGDVQHMSAGSGVTHSEYNPSKTESVHFLQIWILPQSSGGAPSYDQRHFAVGDRQNRLRLVASADGRDGSIRVRQNISLYASVLEPGATVEHTIPTGRKAWVQVARGTLDLEGRQLSAGDGVATDDPSTLNLRATSAAEVLLFDLA